MIIFNTLSNDVSEISRAPHKTDTNPLKWKTTTLAAAGSRFPSCLSTFSALVARKSSLCHCQIVDLFFLFRTVTSRRSCLLVRALQTRSLL